MRVLSVVPRYAVTVGSLKAHRGGTVIGKTREERGNCVYSKIQALSHSVFVLFITFRKIQVI